MMSQTTNQNPIANPMQIPKSNVSKKTTYLSNQRFEETGLGENVSDNVSKNLNIDTSRAFNEDKSFLEHSITMFYDDTCVLCTTNAIDMQARAPKKIRIVPVDMGLDELTQAGVSRTQAMTYVCVQDNMGIMHKGMDAVRLLYDTAGVPIANILHLPLIKQLSNFFYPIIARHRYYFPKWLIRLIYGKVADLQCPSGNCQLPPSKRS